MPPVKYIFFVAFILCAAFAYAQNNKKIERLFNSLAGALSDTAKARIYDELAIEYDDIDSLKSYDYQRRALAIFKKYNNIGGIAENYQAWGIILNNLNKKDSSLIVYQMAVSLAEKAGDLNLQGSLYVNIGLVYSNLRDLPRASEYYNKAYVVSEKTGNKRLMGNATRKLANIYLHEEDYLKALSNFKKAYSLYEEANDSASMGECLGSIGFASRYANMPDSAIAYFNKAIAVFNKVNYKTFIPIAYTEIGRTYFEQEHYTLAVENFKKALELYKGIQYEDHVDALDIFTGQALTELHQYEEAQRYLEAGKALAIKTNDLEMQREAEDGLYNYYLKTKNYVKALEALKQFNNLKDTIIKKEQLQTTTELNAKYESEKKERQIQQQQLEITTRNYQITKRNYWIAGISAITVLSSLLLYQLYRRNRLKQKTKLQAEILHQQELAAKAIVEAEENERKRISRDLHDGVGQMMSAARMNLSAIENNIYFTTEEHKLNFEKVILLIDESCNEVRTVSHNMMPNALLKAGLSSAVRDFIDKIDSTVIKVNLHTEGLNERIDSNTETVLYRVIQECVNNVIKHAKATTLDISLIKDIDGISATIEDNGHGFDLAGANGFDGIGLKNIQSRINYLKGTVEWDSKINKGTVVAMHVPVE